MVRQSYYLCARSSMPVGPDPDSIHLDLAASENTTHQQQQDWESTKKGKSSYQARQKPTSPETTQQPSKIVKAEAEPSQSAQNTPPAPTEKLKGSRTLAEGKLCGNQKNTPQEKIAASVSENVWTPPHLRKANIARKAAEALAVAEQVPHAGKTSEINHSKSAEGGSGPPSTRQATPAVDKPPSPPTTNPEPEKVMDYWGNGNLQQTGMPHSPPASPWQGKKAKGPRGPKPPYKKHVWPKARDMKPLSESENNGNEDNGPVNGWPENKEDDVHDVKKLLDWEGNWQPPPESWTERNRNTSRDWAKDMDNFIVTNIELLQPMKIEEPAFSGRKTVGACAAPYVPGETVPGRFEYNEIVPRYWLEPRVEQKTLLQYWKDLVRSSAEPVDACHDEPHAPWWDRFQEKNSCYVVPLPGPTARVNMADEEYPTRPDDLICIDDKLKIILQRRQAYHDKIMAKRNRPIPQTRVLVPPVDDRRIHPGGNFYVRPVQAPDVQGIASIYNWYIENTIFANEMSARTEGQIRDRINNITTPGLPFFVAVSLNSKASPKSAYVNEQIIGYIGLDDYVGPSSILRYTYEMELYTHPEFRRQGVAKCLLDKLIEYADTSYTARGGYTYKNDTEYLKSGPARVIKTILLNVYHESEEAIEYQNKCLHGFGFKRCARIPGVGYKRGKKIDISTFYHHTSESIDPHSIPHVF